MANLEKNKLINTLRAQGIDNTAILKAMSDIPREKFVSEDKNPLAYKNTPLPIDCEQTISQPYIVASMTQTLLGAPKVSKVLEIGTGSGYQAAVLAQLVKEVYTIERFEKLHLQSNEVFKELGYSNIHTLYADGNEGWPSAAPFDAIIVTACAAKLPKKLLEQLSNNGRLIAPVGGKHHQELVQVDKRDDQFIITHLEPVRFVPLKPGKQ